MTPQELLDHYKSRIKAASEIRVTEQTIKNWEAKEKIPYIAQLAIQTLTKGKLKVDKGDLK